MRPSVVVSASRRGAARRSATCAVLLATLAGGWTRLADASCNVIPSSETTFVSALGGTTRPFAAPGEPLEIRLSQLCPTASRGFGDGSNLAVHVVFKPLASSAPPEAVSFVLPQSAFSSFPTPHIVVAFPSTANHAPAGPDGRAGPAMIVVTDASAPPPDPSSDCQSLVAACGGQCAHLVACVDDLFLPAGGCTGRGRRQPVFPHFTALPVPNDFSKLCVGSAQCTGTLTDDAEARFTVDADGNLLLPMQWQGILPPRDPLDDPIPRLLVGSTSVDAFAPRPGPIRIPGKSFVGSFTPEGVRLDPIFEPEADPTAAQEVKFFGSADAPYTVLRIERRSRALLRCAGGDNNGLPCETADDCPCVQGCPAAPACTETVCVSTCADGNFVGAPCVSSNDPLYGCGGGTCGPPNSNPGTPCRLDTSCSGGTCGPPLFDFSDRFNAGVGPVVVKRSSGLVLRMVPRATLPSYDAKAGDMAALGGLFQTRQLSAFVVTETAAQDLNGNGAYADEQVITLRNRRTREITPIGPGLPRFPGLAIEPISEDIDRLVRKMTDSPSFTFPPVAVEGDVLAFLEDEGTQQTDENHNGRFESILRVFHLDGTESSGSPLQAVEKDPDPPPLIDGRALIVSNGLVFVRQTIGPDTVLGVLDARASAPALAPIGPIDPVSSQQPASVAGGSAVFFGPGGAAKLYRNPRPAQPIPSPTTEPLGQSFSTVALSGLCADTRACRTDEDCTTGACAAKWLAAIDLAGIFQAVDVSTVPPTATSGCVKADAANVAGTIAAVITPESAQGQSLDGDSDQVDRVIQIYDQLPPVCANIINTRQPAEEFVIGDVAVAFRTYEGDLCQGTSPLPDCKNPGASGCPLAQCDLNQDGDCCDDVLQAYDLNQHKVVNSKTVVTPCGQKACDPLTPYRIFSHKRCHGGRNNLGPCRQNSDCPLDAIPNPADPPPSCGPSDTVKFISRECEQGCTPGPGVKPNCIPPDFYSPCYFGGGTFSDLNGDGRIGNTVIEVLDVDTGAVANAGTIGSLDPDFDPLAEPVGLTDGGRCALPTIPTTCSDCPAGTFCLQIRTGSSLRCVRNAPTNCTLFPDCTPLNCPAGGSCYCPAGPECPDTSDKCIPASLVTAPADSDDDGVVDTTDNCPFDPNPGQEDTDHDGVGDACDTQTCGDGIRQDPEECDDHNAVSGDGCTADCKLELGSFRSYLARPKVGTPRFAPRNVSVVDRFGTKTMTAVRPNAFASPEQVDGVGALDSTAHLACYHLSGRNGQPGFTSQEIKVQNRFGPITLRAIFPQVAICLPSSKDGIPVFSGLDEMQCYKARLKARTGRWVPRAANLADEFKTSTSTVMGPTTLCVPASRDGGTIRQAGALLTCYRLKDLSAQANSANQDVLVGNPFGPETLTAFFSSPTSGKALRSQLCVPSTVVP